MNFNTGANMLNMLFEINNTINNIIYFNNKA